MKSILLVLLIVIALTSAEPPAYRAAKFGNQRPQQQQAAPGSNIETLEPDAEVKGKSGPYPPSGWKPSGARLELPRAEVATQPPAQYLPASEYGSPFGAIESTTLGDDETVTTEADVETTTPPGANDSSSEESDETSEKANLIEDLDEETVQVEAVPEQKVNQQGSYFVILPNTRIQRVLYTVQQDPERLQFSTRLQSVGNQAHTGPLVFFTPQYVQIV